ncbi:MAG: hypothetical protein F4Y49_09785 [Dehalococcoidia bacterium]|nr:hypothetical protein [Dehalococcoidia bacterium]
MRRKSGIIASVLIGFIFLMVIHQLYMDNLFRYIFLEETLVILRIFIGVQFAVGIKIIMDAIVDKYQKSVEWTFLGLTMIGVFLIPVLAIVARFASQMLME